MQRAQLGRFIQNSILPLCNFLGKVPKFESFYCHKVQSRCLRHHTQSISGHSIGTLAQPENEVDPFTVVKSEIPALFANIRKELSVRQSISEVATYHFDGQGKCMRPIMNLLMAGAINNHLWSDSTVMDSQKVMAQVSEMVHVSSLLHDDVIDGSDTRRGKPTVHSRFTHRKSIFGGDYILSVANDMIAKLRSKEIVVVVSQILVDLVEGEFMQLEEANGNRFTHYLQKTYNKTASLLANSCKAEVVLSGGDEDLQEIAFQYGKNCGIAFQLVDDVLDFTPSSTLGKPNFSDLKSGVATAPVLYAAESFPELNGMISRRFQNNGDCEKALDFVYRSDGIQKTHVLAQKHCEEAIKEISKIKDSPERQALILLTSDIINRRK